MVLRRIYTHQLKNWPVFQWDAEKLTETPARVRFRQGRLIGHMQALGFSLREEAQLQNMTEEVLKTSEIEGETLNPDQVRSSLARRLGIDIAGSVPADLSVEGVVEMMLDATQQYEKPLTTDRLFAWHASLFPTGRSGMYPITVGAWRTGERGPMQVVSGAMGKEKVHFEAPQASRLEDEINQFLLWFNGPDEMDPVIKAAVAHIWFVTIHPFDDGNGRIARAIADLQLARADGVEQRFYSMSSQIRKERNANYNILEETQKGNLDITGWLEWFLNCLERALMATDEMLASVMKKAKFWEQHKQVQFNERQLKMLNRLLDGMEGKLTSSNWAKMAKCSQDTAARDIQDLIKRRILRKEPGGGRSTSYALVND